MIDLLLANQ